MWFAQLQTSHPVNHIRNLLTRLRRTVARSVSSARIRLGQPGTAPVRVVKAPPVTIDLPQSESQGFDAERAFAILQAQCDRGPRHPGSDGHRWTRQLILEQLGAFADEVAVQEWDQKVSRGPGAGDTFALTNVFGVFRGSASDSSDATDLMLSAHWDTRPVADHDPDPARRGEPVPGANDGASGVAVLLELARVLARNRPLTTTVLAFWDGEDFGEYYYGSRLFSRMVRRPDFARWRARRGVLIDMVGGHPLHCVTEANSVEAAPALWTELHAHASRLGMGQHFNGPAMRITDDHVFLNRAGIPTILLIDYSYPHWHTTHDTPDKCSAESLGVIGAVLQSYAGAVG